VEALCELVADAGRRTALGEAGRAWCLERFAAERMVDALERLYLRLQ
jgi:hypothetical protein